MEYVKALIRSCGCQMVSKVDPNEGLGSSMAKYNKILTFYVDVRMNDGVDNETLTISIYGPHSGHVSCSRSDVYHLPAHPMS
mgnify:CR=1 FL=1